MIDKKACTLKNLLYFCSRFKSKLSADVAQLVEQLICNQPVGGSSPFIGSFFKKIENKLLGGFQSGQMGQTVNLLAKPSEVRILLPPHPCGSSSFGRAKAFQALGGRFEPGLPLQDLSF